MVINFRVLKNKGFLGKIFLSLLVGNSFLIENSFAEEKVESNQQINKIRKSANILTVITSDEINISGARDLQEILEKTPGIVFSGDKNNSVGIGYRGILSSEGRSLLVIDGQIINDGLFSSVSYGNHFPASSIKEVDIYRSPDNINFGNTADLMIIDVKTKSAEDINGLSISTNFSIIPNDLPDYSHRNVNLSYGQKIDDFTIVAHGSLGLGNRSNNIFKDFYNNSFDMTTNAEMNQRFFNVGIGYKDFSLKLITDIYNNSTRDGYGYNLPSTLPVFNYGYYTEAKYDFKINDRVTLTPKVNYRYQLPNVVNTNDALDLNNKNPDKYPIYYNKTVRRVSGDLKLNADISENINFLLGTEVYNDYAESLNEKSSDFGTTKNLSAISYNDFSAYTQGLIKLGFLDFSLGANYENNSGYGFTLSPKAALISNIGNFNGKLIYNNAFRMPSIENINKYIAISGKTIQAENNNDIELQLGYQFTENMFINATLFNNYIKNPLIYYYDKNDIYSNFESIGTRGFEAEYQFKDKRWGFANIIYSYYQAHDNLVDKYSISNTNDLLLGYPTHKFVFNTSFYPIENFSINPSLVFYSERYGYNSIDRNGKPVIQKYPANFMVNMGLRYRNLFINGLTLDFTAYNILNQAYYYITPYTSIHASIPSSSTELSFNLSYDFTIDSKQDK